MPPKSTLPSQQRTSRLTVISTLALVVAIFANSYYGPRFGEIAKPYSNVFSRSRQHIVAGWILLYSSELGFLSALSSKNVKIVGPASGAVGYTFSLAHVLKLLWGVAWLKREFVISEAMICLNLLNLFSAYRSLHKKDPSPTTRSLLQNHLPIRFYLSIMIMDFLQNGAMIFPQLLTGTKSLLTTGVVGLIVLALPSLYKDAVLRFAIALHFFLLSLEQESLSLSPHQGNSCLTIAVLSAVLGIKDLFAKKLVKGKKK